LVVDDSPDNRVLLGEYLEGANVDVAFADDGPAALSMANATSYDAVLMDLQMPQLDGYATTRELLRMLHARGVNPPPVVALSAHALADTFARSRDAGCTLQLTKPIRKRVLLETLARVCDARISDTPPRAGRTTAEDLKPLLPQYLANRTRDVAAIRAALGRGDLSIITKLAHNMRGTGTSYGFPELSELAMRLEDAATAEALTLLATLADELDGVVTSLQSRLDAGRKPSGTRVRAQSVPDVESRDEPSEVDEVRRRSYP
jgi:CheY-like chemotaxis protein